MLSHKNYEKFLNLFHSGFYKAILFDKDGVIIDSLPYYVMAWINAFQKIFAIGILPLDVYLSEGQKSEEFALCVLKTLNINFTSSQFNDLLNEKDRFFQTHFKPEIFPGMIEILDFFKEKGFKLAIVTGSRMAMLNFQIEKNLLSYFDVIVTGDSVKKSKPDPEPFLKASELLHIIPEKCMVIENAPLGIQSANSAGMFCISVRSYLEEHYLKNSDLIVKNLIELKKILNF